MLQSNLSTSSKVFITLLSEISERDKIILIERFIKEKSLKKVAKQFKLSDARLKEIEDQLIKRIDQLYEFNLTKISRA